VAFLPLCHFTPWLVHSPARSPHAPGSLPPPAHLPSGLFALWLVHPLADSPIWPGSFVPGLLTTWLVHHYIFDDSPPHQFALLSCKEKLYNWANMVTNHSHIMVTITVNYRNSMTLSSKTFMAKPNCSNWFSKTIKVARNCGHTDKYCTKSMYLRRCKSRKNTYILLRADKLPSKYQCFFF